MANQFQPKWNEDQTRQILASYKGRNLSPGLKEELENHASYHGVPFYIDDFSIIDAIKQAGAGFIEGFTTINPGVDHPDNEYEAIVRNLGHLAGFVPGMVAAPLKAVGLRGMAAKFARMKSLPMIGADKITKYTKTKLKAAGIGSVGRSEALKTANQFYLGEKAKHIAEGAFHLGAASALSSWKGGIDEMLYSGMHGAKFGGVFRTIGNLVPGTAAHSKMTRAVAGSLFQGLPSTQQGMTTPEQVYEYAMGAYFGGKEMSWARAKAHKVVNKTAKKMSSDPKFYAISRGDPEFLPEWKDLPEPVKPIAKEIAKERFKDYDEQLGMSYLLAEQMGEADKVIPDLDSKVKRVEYREGEEVKIIDADKIPKLKDMVFVGSNKEGSDPEITTKATTKGHGVTHFTFKGHDKSIKGDGFQRRLTPRELQEANADVEMANRTLQRDTSKLSEYEWNLIRKNSYKAKFSDSIYAFDEIASSKSDNFKKEYTTRVDKKAKKKTTAKTIYTGNQHRTTKGDSKWLVQMGIDKGKKVFVHDPVKKGWYAWNQEAGRFTRINDPPRPGNRFAAVGTRSKDANATKTSKKAISEFFDKYWADSTTVPEKLADTAETKAQRSKVEKRLETIDTLLERLESNVAEINDAVTIAKSKGASKAEIAEIEVPKRLYEQQYERLTEEANQLKNMNVKVGKTEPINDPENKEVANDETSQKGDYEGVTELEIGKRAEQFTKKHLKTLWSGGLPEDITVTSLDASIKVNELLNSRDNQGSLKYINRGSKENKSEQFASDLEKAIQRDYKIKGFSLSNEAKGELRQWITIRNNGNMVTHLQSDGVTVNRMSNDSNPRSLSGSRKHQVEPKKAIEFAFEDAGGTVEVGANGTKKNPVYIVGDHVTIEGKDYELSRFRDNYLLKEAGYDIDKADKMYNNYLSNAMNTMNKDGYYAFGGRADADRLHWVRYHPELNDYLPSWKELLSRKDHVKGDILTDPIFTSDYKDAKLLFKNKYGAEITKDYDKMYLSNLLYDASMNFGKNFTSNHINLMMGDGFIKDSKAFNKRSQVWFTNGWEADTKFLKKQKVGGKLIELNDNDKYNYIITRDLPEKLTSSMTKKELKAYQSLLNTINTHNPEHVDGAIIVRDDILTAMLRDFGVPHSGQGKSFIVSPHKDHGALLGKFMFHSAGKTMSEMMRQKDNLHMIMQESAVKQTGARDIGDYDVSSRGLKINAPVYELDPIHVKGSYGVYGNRHMLERQNLPKQVLGNFVALSKNRIDQKVIDEMFDDIIGRRFQGDEAWNEAMNTYLERVSSGEGSKESLREMETTLMHNIDQIGIRQLVTAMKSDHALNMTEAIYKQILKIEKNDIYQEYLDGELSEAEYHRISAEMNETSSIIDKTIKTAEQWASEQRAAGVDVASTPIYMHKFIRDFRMRAVQNFIVGSATKPKMNNSATAFMRPYDKAMQGNIDKSSDLLSKHNKEGINYKDDIFLLDNEHRKIPIHTGLPGKDSIIALGRLWDRYQDGEWKDNPEVQAMIQEIFRAATVRVPIDSISGTKIGKFGGFTGREGHGILLHSRAMKAEGGADLDGDKSFIFFGGEGGWKKNWKDAFHSNKSEHYSKDGTRVSDNKEATIDSGKWKKYGSYSKLLSQEFTPTEERWYGSKAFQYSPGERLRISQAAVDGRNLLGPAVIQKQVMTATYNSIVAGGGNDVFEYEAYEGKPGKKKKVHYQISIKAKEGEEALEAQRKLGRAQLGLASDPLDVLGLKKKDQWFEYMWDAHFEVVDVKKRVKNNWMSNSKKLKELKKIEGQSHALTGGILGDYYDINKAYWGKNWKEGRRYSMAEIKDLGSAIYNINENPTRVNNVLAKTGELLHGLDWSDSIFGRLSKEKVNQLYKEQAKNIKEFDWLKRMLGRTSFKTEMGHYISNTMKFSLWKEHNVIDKKTGKVVGGLNAVAQDLPTFRKAIQGTLFAKNPELMAKAAKSLSVRRDILSQMRALSEDFISNDMTDLTTLKNVSRIVTEMKDTGDIGLSQEGVKTLRLKTLDEVVEAIHRRAQFLKQNSYLMKRDRTNADSRSDINVLEHTKEAIEENNRIKAKFPEIFGKPKTHKQKVAVGDDVSATLDQAQIDKMITEFKVNLSPSGEKLFDHLLLGSLNRSNLGKIDDAIKNVGQLDKASMDLIHSYRNEAAKTNTSKLGFNSDEVSQEAFKEHLGSYLGTFNKMWRPPTEKQINSVLTAVNEKVETPKTKEEAGMPDDEFVPFMSESVMESGYKGLKPSKTLTKADKSLITEIATMLKSYNNKLGQDLNGLTRGLDFIGKDLNAMNKQDFLMLRNYLHEAKRGNFIQRHFKKKGPVQLGLRHWMQLPQAVGREFQRDDIQIAYENGFFTDRYGNRREGPVARPTNYIDMLSNKLSLMVEKQAANGDKLVGEFQEKIQFIQELPDADALWQIAVRTRETNLAKSIAKAKDGRPTEQQAIMKYIYSKYNETNKKFSYDKSIKNKEYTVTINGKRGKLTGEQIVTEINKR